MTTKQTPADVLREARRADSIRKRAQVFRTVDEMKRDGAVITFAAVARAAKVSTWLVYAEGVRDYVTAAREYQAAEPTRAKRAGRLATDASLRTDLELTQQDNRALRAEIERLKTVLRERLGHELEAESSNSLRRRVDELTAANTRYRKESETLAATVEDFTVQIRTLEDDLAAARTSLRRMIKDAATQERERSSGQ